jgi:uncharacterized phage-associated protein
MDDLVYAAVAVANEFLRRARESRQVLSATQLHELVYCAHGWHLVVAGQPLISGPVAAHRGGVYIPDLKSAGCWGVGPVQGLLHLVDDVQTFPRVEAGTPARFTIDHVWDDYGPLSRYDLTRFTLTEKGPWDQVWNADGRHESALVPNRLLREWFGQVATWRTAAEHVSIAVDRVMQQSAERSAPVVVGRTHEDRPADNDAIADDRSQVREFREQSRLSQFR